MDFDKFIGVAAILLIITFFVLVGINTNEKNQTEKIRIEKLTQYNNTIKSKLNILELIFDNIKEAKIHGSYDSALGFGSGYIDGHATSNIQFYIKKEEAEKIKENFSNLKPDEYLSFKVVQIKHDPFILEKDMVTNWTESDIAVQKKSIIGYIIKIPSEIKDMPCFISNLTY